MDRTEQGIHGTNTCPWCEADLTYVVEDQEYTHAIGMNIQGAYDGILFWVCPFCKKCWHRWPLGHYLREKAKTFFNDITGNSWGMK